MPYRRHHMTMGTARRHRRLMGGSFREKVGHWLKKVASFAKEHKLVSKIANFAAPHTGKYQPLVSRVGHIASAIGLGRHHHRHRRGGSLRLSGM